jgi:hypothetical protein
VSFVVIVCLRGRYNRLMRSKRATVGVALALWIVLALVVWNVVFDRVLVVAGRQYVHAATRSARDSGPYLRVDDWMRPAERRALRMANVAGGTILAAGLVSIGLATRKSLKSEV